MHACFVLLYFLTYSHTEPQFSSYYLTRRAPVDISGTSSDLVGRSPTQLTGIDDENVFRVEPNRQTPRVSIPLLVDESGPSALTKVLVDEQVAVGTGADDDRAVLAADGGEDVVRAARGELAVRRSERLTLDVSEVEGVLGDLVVDGKVG